MSSRGDMRSAISAAYAGIRRGRAMSQARAEGRPFQQMGAGGRRVPSVAARRRLQMGFWTRDIPRVIPPQIPRGFITSAAADAKFFDVASAGYALNTTGSITHLDIIPQGTTVNSREGKSYRVKSVLIRGFLAADTTTTTCQYGIYLVWDKQPNKALAAITDVLVSANSSAFTNRENAGRFIILKKWHGVLSGNVTAPTSYPTIVDIDERYVCPPGLISEKTNADTTGVIGNTINGALLLVTVGNQAAGTADANLSAGFRINFGET